MNVILITTFYPQPNRKDLIQDTSAIHYITREWVKQGHDVTVIHCYRHYFRELIKEFGKHDFRQFVKIQECPVNEGVRVLLMENQLWIRNQKWYFPIQQKRIAEEINRYFREKMPYYKPDILLVHFPTQHIGITEKLNFKCRKAAIFHKTDVANLQAAPKAVQKLQNVYDIMGTRSVQLQKKLRKCGIETTFIAQSGIEANNIISDDSFIEKWKDKKNGVLNIVYAGGVTKDKNVGTILKALGMLRDKVKFSFTIVGDGNCKENCVKIAKKNQIADACHFTGRLSRLETVARMREADVFIMVSIRETLGLVYLEAMSQGCITVGSRGEGIDGILENKKNGYLVQPGNAEELADRILAIAKSSPEEKRRIAYAGLETIRQMTSDKTAENYLKSVL